MRTSRLLLSFLATLSIIACTTEPAAQSNKRQQAAVQTTQAMQSTRQPFLLRKHVVVDQQGFGCEAFHLLAPKDWNFRGAVNWNAGKIPPEVQTTYSVTSPDGRAAIERFPFLFMYWSQDPMMQQAFAGNGASIMQPMQADEFLKNFYMSRFRPGASGVRVIDSKPLPELAQRSLQINQYLMNIFGQISPFQFPFEQRSDAAHVRFEYTQDGRQMMEDVTANIDYFISTTGSMYGTMQSVTWMPYVTTFRAPAEEFDKQAFAYKVVMSTYADNPRWSVELTRLTATVTREQLRQQEAIFQRMQQIHRTQEEIGDMIYEGYRQRSAASDRIFDNYIQGLRGLETYADPVNNSNVQLPTGYENAWTNGSDYMLSDSVSFDPNIGSTQNWHRMDRKP